MSKQRSQKPRIEGALSDEQSITTQIFDATDPETLPFPEWSDQDINGEKWDGLLGKEKTPNSRLNLVSSTIIFEDPQEVHVPPSLGAHQWKRCSEIFPDANFSVFVNKPTYPDLVTPNHHILKSEFYRSFISSIETLLYIGSSKPFPEEYGSPSGYYAQADRSWRPWHHIYSNCKVAKGSSEHMPLYNPYGKYVVRLYWMGTWRKIYVDDYIPVDKTNAILLPSLHIPTAKSLQLDMVEGKTNKPLKEKLKGAIKKEMVELWPLILCKALLKIGSLSWSTQQELNDFDIINCLTGWIPQRIKTKDISSSDLWEIFMAYIERFEWEDGAEGSIKKMGTKTKAKGTEKQDTSKKSTKAVIPSGLENMQDGDRYVVVSCDNLEFSRQGVEFGKHLQSWNMGVFISQVRDIPLIKPPPRPELELWQKFRYEEWAVERGIIPPDIPKLNIKTLKIADPFKRIFKATQENEDFEWKTQASADTEITDKKSEKSSKASKKPKERGLKNSLEPDPTMWIDFDEIKTCVNHIQIYFQPRGFKAKAKISDINFQNKTTDFKHIISPANLKVRNEPIYLFTDSIDYKFLVINYTQIGNLQQLDRHIEDVETLLVQTCTKEHDMCVEIVLKKTEKKDEIDKSVSQISNKSTILCSFNTKPVNFVLEEYCWDTNEFGESKGMIQTFGSKSIIIDLQPGRKSFRLWVSSHCPYVLQVFSDTPMTIGHLDEYITACTAESQLLTNLCYEFSSCFGKLVQSFGMPEYSISLRNFYQSYKPFEHLKNDELVTVHKALFEEFCNVIVNSTTSQNALECVRLLFLQLKTYDYINPYKETPHLCFDKLFNLTQIDYAKKMQRAAVKIQAFFKGVYIRLLMKKLNEDHRQYNGIFETIKKVYSEVFSSDKRLNNCPKLFRNLFERKDMEKLKEKFETYRDIRSVVCLYTFTDYQFIYEAGWVPICRYEFHVNSRKPIPIKINLFCNLKSYYVRVFNNDTEKELKRYTNNVAVEKYESNALGYTILSYGWAEENTKLNWKLVLTKKKMSRTGLLFIPSMPTSTINLRDFYMPNFDNVICRYNVKVNSDVFLTANLRTSYDQVKLCLKLKDEDGKIIYTSKGTGSALLPVIHLRYKEMSNEELAVLGLQRKKKLTTSSRLSEITYSKFHKKHAVSTESVSFRNGSQRKVSVGTEAPESKRPRNSKKRGSTMKGNDVDADNTSERSHDSTGRNTRPRKSKVRQSDVSDADSLSERSGRKSFLKSRSFEKLNKGFFLEEKSRVSSVHRQVVLNKVMETHHTQYTLEGIVLNDSWPLTAEEWQRTQQLKERSYLNLLEERKSYSSKRSIINRRIDEPYWILDLVHAQEDSLEFEEDCSKSIKRKEVKMKWFQNKDRYQKGVELRDAYLKENLVSNENIIDNDRVRSNNPQDFALKIIKEPPMEEFLIKPSETEDEDACTTKLSEDYFIDETNIEKTLREYKGDERAIHDDNEELLQKQIQNFHVLLQWYTEIRNDSAEMTAQAVNLKKEYVKKISDHLGKSKYDKTAKETKKKK